MIKIRRSTERGQKDHGWLKTYHTFSFADYYDPLFMGFRTLRVINEDYIAPGKGFGTHAHQDMEIITYVLQGEIAHKDSMGHGSVIKQGDVQRMTAGTGVTHSEFNNSNQSLAHLLQIWILPSQKGLVPSYEQRNYSKEERTNLLTLIASPSGLNGSVILHQNVNIFSSLLDAQKSLTYKIDPKRHVYLQMARGNVSLQEYHLEAGDGAMISQEKEVSITANTGSEFLLFDLA